MNYIAAPWIVRLTNGPVLSGAEVYYLTNQPTATIATVNLQLLANIYTDSTGATPAANPVMTDGFGNANTGYSAIQPYVASGVVTVAVVYNGTVMSVDVDQIYGLLVVPAPTTSLLGGVLSTTATPHEWMTSIDTTGTPRVSQPAFSDLSGNIAISQINSGTGASSATFLRGDNAWVTPIGGGNVVGPSVSVVGEYAIYNNTSGTLLADGGQQPGYRNLLINGAFDIDQRNQFNSLTFTSALTMYYTADRWFGYSIAGGSTGQAVTTAALVNGFAYFPNGYVLTPGATAGAVLGQRIEQARMAHMYYNTPLMLGVWIKASTPCTVSWDASVPGTINSFGTISAPTKTQIATGTFSVGTSWAFYTAVINSSTAFTLGLEVLLAVPTLGATGTVSFTGIQVEASTVATPFEVVGPTRLLQDCQRYYNPGGYVQNIMGSGASEYVQQVQYYPVPMRAAPTVSLNLIFGSSLAVITSYAYGFSWSINRDTNGYAVFSWSASAEL